MSDNDRIGLKALWQFVGLTFGISWLSWLFVWLSGRDPFSDLESGVMLVLGGFGPAIAAIVMVARTFEPHERQAYWQRVFNPRRIRPLWLLPILLLYPLSTLLAYPFVGQMPDFSPLLTLLRNPGSLVVTLVFVFIFGPFAEELGWRGYALDRLQERFSAFWSSVILGVIWWAWHLPLLAVQGSFLNTTSLDPVFLAGYLGTVLIYAVLFTWVYNNNNRSVLAIVLFHFSVNLTSRLIAMPAEVFMVLTGILIVEMLAVIVWFGPKRLVRAAKQAGPAH